MNDIPHNQEISFGGISFAQDCNEDTPLDVSSYTLKREMKLA